MIKANTTFIYFNMIVVAKKSRFRKEIKQETNILYFQGYKNQGMADIQQQKLRKQFRGKKNIHKQPFKILIKKPQRKKKSGKAK